MSAATTTPLIIIPDKEIIDEERYELAFSNASFVKPFTVVPWRTATDDKEFRAKLKDLIPEEFRYATSVRWSWTNPTITNLIRELGFKKVFCTSTENKPFPFEQIPYIDYVRPDIYCAKEKTIRFSFVGWNGNPVRNRIFELYKGNSSVISREVFHGVLANADHERSKENAKQYADILAQSRFCLCPKGEGSGTIRFWEALKAGAIPVVISNNLRYPNCWNWLETIVAVNEYSMLTQKYVLESVMSMSREKEAKMRANCLAAYDYFYNNPANLVKYINSHL